MSKDEMEKESTIKVEDKRRFSIDKNGNVVGKDEKAKAEDAAVPPVADEQPKEQPVDTSSGDSKTETEAGSEPEGGELPPMTFNTLIFSLSTQAMISLGEFPDPMSGEVSKNKEHARQSIDLLGILAEKTKGNLTKDEDQFLQSSLTDLRLRFVQCCKE